MDYSHQAPLFLGFSSQEYWSGLPFPSPGNLPNPGIEPMSPALQADSLPSEPSGKSLDRGFPGVSVDKESAYNVGDLGVIPGWGRSPGV